MEENTGYEGYAIVELMGHNTLAGYISEQTVAGTAMLRIDVPAVGGIEKYTKFVSGGAIYGITPTTQEIAERAASRLQMRPVSQYIVSAPPADRPALVDSTTGDEHEEEYEDYEESEEYAEHG